jgi:hypothetical protein
VSQSHVPVAVNVQTLNRDPGPEGQFYRAHFAGRENTTFVATAAGRLLERGWADWQNLPAAERAPGATAVEPLPPGRGADPEPPPGALVAKVYLRTFQRPPSGFACEQLCGGGGRQEAEVGRDHLWLTRAEWRALVPDRPEPGARLPLPPAVLRRLVRFHLLLTPDRIVGRPWTAGDVRRADLALTVDEVRPDRLRLRLDGPFWLGSPDEQSGCGYQGRVGGELVYDRAAGAFTRFDVVAFGRFWNRGNDWRAGRPPTGWLGVAFELPDPPRPGGGMPAPPYLLVRDADYFGRN